MSYTSIGAFFGTYNKKSCAFSINCSIDLSYIHLVVVDTKKHPLLLKPKERSKEIHEQIAQLEQWKTAVENKVTDCIFPREIITAFGIYFLKDFKTKITQKPYFPEEWKAAKNRASLELLPDNKLHISYNDHHLYCDSKKPNEIVFVYKTNTFKVSDCAERILEVFADRLFNEYIVYFKKQAHFDLIDWLKKK